MERDKSALGSSYRFGLTLAGLAANYDDFAANGNCWVIVDGPYGCLRDDLHKIVKNRTDDLELQFVEQVRAYLPYTRSRG
jgi:hypothetical protein